MAYAMSFGADHSYYLLLDVKFVAVPCKLLCFIFHIFTTCVVIGRTYEGFSSLSNSIFVFCFKRKTKIHMCVCILIFMLDQQQ